MASRLRRTLSCMVGIGLAPLYIFGVVRFFIWYDAFSVSTPYIDDSVFVSGALFLMMMVIFLGSVLFVPRVAAFFVSGHDPHQKWTLRNGK